MSVPERVVRSARGGKVDLELQFSEFFGGPFTLSTWFQPEFVRAYAGPILAESGSGRFSIGMGEYSHDTSMLQLRVGQKTVNYRVPDLQRRQWYHLAVTRSNTTISTGAYSFSVYLDGQKLTPQRFDVIEGGPCVPTPCPDIPVIINVPEISFSTSDPMEQVPNGSVRIGRLASSYDPFYWQFYGLVDEVAVYRGLTSISTLAAARQVVETTALIKGFTFDLVLSMNPKLKHGATYTAPTTAVPYGMSLTSIFDMPEYASPTEGTYVLPFASGQAWKAIQEFDDTTSHHGGSAFCWDFVRVGTTTQDTSVYAAADGDVVVINDSTDDEGYEIPSDWKNQPWSVRIRTAPDEATSHLHLREESVEQAVCPGDACDPLPTEEDNFVSVDASQKVGVVGTSKNPSNSHLHFGLRGLQGAETHTIPMAFSNYDTCVLAAGETVTTTADLSKCTWRRVARGMPRQGEIIRRP